MIYNKPLGLTMRKSLFLILLLIIPQISFSKDTLIAGVFNILPYAYEENNKIIGITPEIIQNIQQESGLHIKVLLLPYKRMLKYLSTGEIDFAIFFLSDESANISEKLIPIYQLKTFVIGNKDSKISNYEDLYNLNLATALGVNYNTILDKNKESLNISYVKDYKNAIEMLNKNRIDAIIAPQKVLEFQLKQFNMKLSDLGEPFVIATNTAWIQFSDKSLKKQYKKALSKAGKSLTDKGMIVKIIDKYYSK